MEPNDTNGAGGDEQGPAKKRRASSTRKRAPSARKQSRKPIQAAEQDEAGAGDGTEPSTAAERTGDRPQAGRSDPSRQRDPSSADYRNGDADRAAQSAADLKAWLDARPEDPDDRREVL